MSMLDIFRHKRSSPASASVSRVASCIELRGPTLAKLNETSFSTSTEQVLETYSLRRCATTRPTTPSGWGIVPVLNELEQRSITSHGNLRRCSSHSASARQLPCSNCQHLFFHDDEQLRVHPTNGTHHSMTPTNQQLHRDRFCSLDCKSSFTCKAAMQQLVDVELNEAIASSSDDDDSSSVMTIDDVANLSL